MGRHRQGNLVVPKDAILTSLKRTPLFDLHTALGAKIVPFAGYEMPVQYKDGVMREHLHTRAHIGLFDVSHMGQIRIRAKSGRYEDAATALETLMPMDVAGLPENRQRYGLLTNPQGGIIDDLMFANRGDHIFVVLNAACKDTDLKHLLQNLPDCDVELLNDKALLALQGPQAGALLGLNSLKFMDVVDHDLHGIPCTISRSGYTGEDGFEISVPADKAAALARHLLTHENVKPIGLGARDSLRLEAGLCLYGHDIDAETTPVEAALTWAIQKNRRRGGAREGGFPGASKILNQLDNGSDKKRVGLRPEGRAPMREGTPLFESVTSSTQIGTITSGGFGPSVQHPISMGYVPSNMTENGTTLFAELRSKRLPVSVTKLPFKTPNYKR